MNFQTIWREARTKQTNKQNNWFVLFVLFLSMGEPVWRWQARCLSPPLPVYFWCSDSKISAFLLPLSVVFFSPSPPITGIESQNRAKQLLHHMFQMPQNWYQLRSRHFLLDDHDFKIRLQSQWKIWKERNCSQAGEQLRVAPPPPPAGCRLSLCSGEALLVSFLQFGCLV